MRRYICTILIAFLSYAASAQTTQILGAPNTRIATKGDMSVDSILYLPRTLVTSRTPTQAGALRYQASDSALYQWTGTQWRKAGGGDVDTNTLSTRAWRQKGIDSVANVRVGGSGTADRIPRWTGTRLLDNSVMYQNNSRIGINVPVPLYVLDVQTETNNRGIVQRGRRTDNRGAMWFTDSTGLVDYFYIDAIQSGTNTIGTAANNPMRLVTNGTNSIFIHANQRVGVNTVTDAGYQFDVAGNMRNTTGAAFATSSGSVGIGTTTPSASYKMDVVGGDIRVREIRVGRGLADISSNTAVGNLALDATTTATSTTAVGNSALKAVTSGIRNTAVGSDAGFSLTTSSNNVFVGFQAGNQLQTGASNVVLGSESMYSNVAGNANISIGAAAMYSLRTSNNIALGSNAGRYANRSETINADSITNSIYIGFGTYSGLKTATNEIVIGSTADGNGSNTVTIGNSSITQNYFRGEMLVGYTSDQGAFSLQANGNALINGNIRTAAPAGGTANDWRLGTVATVSPTSPNRTIEVSIGGTIYYIHAKTTND